ncbi:MAG: PIN domain-containing protein [Xanthobacteraceae bacterium]|nr:MAG: PIN domain-containing protein [Xanthobacteraceae bacterium]
MADKPRYYWDACAWIALIQQEEGRFDSLSHLIEEAKKGNVEIWTSNFTLAEVFKRPCDGEKKSLTTADDVPFEDFILQGFVTRVQVDLDVETLARRLLRAYPKIGKPQDAIHVATALLNNIDELHTYDREDLLGLSGKIDRKDGAKLKICKPPQPPLPQQPAKTPLEEAIDKASAEDVENKASGSGGHGQ